MIDYYKNAILSFREKEFNENYYGFQVYLPQPMLISVPMSFPNFAIPPPSTPFALHSSIEENKEGKVFQITRKIPNYRKKSSEMISMSRDKFVPFSVSLTIAFL